MKKLRTDSCAACAPTELRRLGCSVASAILCASLALAGCNRPLSETAPPSVKQRAETSLQDFTPELNSPDFAVKSWWRFIDACDAYAETRCAEYSALAEKAASKLAVQSVSESFGQRNCARDIFERQIAEVKVESETRAVVMATIRNVTPVPEGLTPDKFDTEMRQNGTHYRYVLEKHDGLWKMAEVYSDGVGTYDRKFVQMYRKQKYVPWNVSAQ